MMSNKQFQQLKVMSYWGSKVTIRLLVLLLSLNKQNWIKSNRQLIRTQGHNHGWKVEGDQGLGHNTGALAPRARPKAGMGVGCGRGSPPSTVRVRGYHPRKICENSDSKWDWILHSGDYMLWNLLLIENYGQEVGGPIHCVTVGPPTYKLMGTSLAPVPTVVVPMLGHETLVETTCVSW